MPDGLDVPLWSGLFTNAAAICAALLGLFFVAMSIRLDDIAGHPVIRARARVSLQTLATLVIQSLLITVPGQVPLVLGIELAVTQLIYLVLTVPGIVGVQGEPSVGAGLRFRTALTALGFALAVAVQLSLILGRGPGLLLEVPVMLGGIAIAMSEAWNVLFPQEIGHPPGQVRSS